MWTYWKILIENDGQKSIDMIHRRRHLEKFITPKILLHQLGSHCLCLLGLVDKICTLTMTKNLFVFGFILIILLTVLSLSAFKSLHNIGRSTIFLSPPSKACNQKSV